MARMTGRNRPTLGFIAKKLDISIATVSRALQDHPALTEETKARVIEMAKEVGYTPNLAARYLVSKRELRIAVNTPHEISSVYDFVRQGIRDEAKPLAGIGLNLSTIPFHIWARDNARHLRKLSRMKLMALSSFPVILRP